MKSLKEIVDSIPAIDNKIEPEITAHLNDLTKPQASLGRLEEIALQYCVAIGTVKPALPKKKIFTFAGDHGVAAEGVSAYPKEVTPQMVRNILAGGAAVNVFGRHVGADVAMVDMGVDDPLEGATGLICRKVRRGTDNIALGPAMSPLEALAAVNTGYELAAEAHKQGYTLLGTGDMGIANTTPSSALFATLLPCGVEEITGRGTGVDDTRLRHKMSVIKKALKINKRRCSDPFSTLTALGGFEIAGICGLILGAAACRIPVVVDGFISSAGALAACKMCSSVKNYIFWSHCSKEKGHRTFFSKFRAKPILNLDMRLGEGTGAALAMGIIDAALKMYNEMATFSSAGVSGKE